ncbi:MAG: serine hydrolase [Verrucomicrobiales bacterium]|nr:serine hydrolase [Verrucomicrobiales bacterium]
MTSLSNRPSLFFVAAIVFTFIGTITPTATASTALEGEIEQYIKGLRGKGIIRSDEKTAWLVYDFTSGSKVATINENSQLQAASMIKPYLALAFFHQVQAGRIIYGSKSRRQMELMIQKSNNESTNWVMQQTGGPTATQALLKRHYPSLCQQISLVEYIPKGGRTYRNQGSAGDYGRFLEALWKGTLPYSKEILRLMALPGIDRLYTDAKRVPAGTAVFNKTGSTAMCCGDMGILVARGRNGKSYPYVVIGIIESGQRNTSYSTWISRRADVIREVSNIVYLNMKKRYPL